jgi:RimJ/RimL family protein N-acetyltransferase
MRYFKKLVGERIYLSPMNTEDAEQYTAWLNDPAVAGNLGQYARAISLVGEQKALEEMAAGDHNYAIVGFLDDRLIGNISLMEINGVQRTAELGMFIGEDSDRGKGIGTEAIRLLLTYGFQWLNLQNIMLTVHADNARAIACYRKAGFTEFGRRRGACFKDGQCVDLVYMDMLRGEFIK